MKSQFSGFARLLKEVGKDTLQELRQAELPTAASSLAYTTILSIVPLLAVSFTIFKVFGGLDQLYEIVEPFIFENLAEGSDERTLAMLRKFIENIHTGALGVGGFLGLIFTSMAMLSSIEKTINKVWRAKVTRPLFQRIATYWMFITLGPIAAALALGLVTSQKIPLGKVLPGNTMLFLTLIPVFYVLYRYIPNRAVHWKAALLSAIPTSYAWIIAKASYGLYVRNALTYGKIYEGLAAIPIFLVWIYVAWFVVLGGAAFSAAIQRRYDLK